MGLGESKIKVKVEDFETLKQSMVRYVDNVNSKFNTKHLVQYNNPYQEISKKIFNKEEEFKSVYLNIAQAFIIENKYKIEAENLKKNIKKLEAELDNSQKLYL